MKVEEKESGKGITNGRTMTVTVDGNTVSGTDWNSKNNKNPYEIDDAKKLTINNSRKISITGTKIWKDQNNACNRRPDAADPKKVVLTVLANGKQVTPQPKVTWDTTNDGTGTWTYKIEGLAKEDANGPIEYTVKEEKVLGYQAAYEQQTKDAKGNIIQNITNSMLKASYKIEKSRLTNATENGKTGTWGFVKGDPVEYQVTVENTGDLELTMDVTDVFTDSALFKELKADKAATGTGVKDNGPCAAAVGVGRNVTIQPGKKATITFTAIVDTDQVFTDEAANRDWTKSDNEGAKGYVNTATASNVKAREEVDGGKDIIYTKDGSNGTQQYPNNNDGSNELADKTDVVKTPVRPKIGYEIAKFRIDAPEKPGTNPKKYGFKRGDTVTYTLTVKNTGTADLTMDVKDEFADSKYFTDLTYTEVKAGKDSAASDVAWNNNAGGGATATAPNITVKAGKTAVIIVTAKVAQDTPEKLSDTTEYRKDPQSKGYLNTMTAINVKGTYTDKDDKGNDKSVVVTEKEFPTELADKKDTCTTPVQVPGTPGTPDTPSGSTNEHKGGRTGKTTKVQVAAPKTGDSANLILYGGIAMVSLVLLLGVLIIFLVKRRHK